MNELLKKGIALKALQESEAVREALLMEGFLKELGKNTGLAAYGIEEVKQAVQARAVKELLVSQKAFLENRTMLEPLMLAVEKANASVHVFMSQGQALEQLEGFGGLAALLRYKTSF